jgi:hypothetical protein
VRTPAEALSAAGRWCCGKLEQLAIMLGVTVDHGIGTGRQDSVPAPDSITVKLV